MLVIVGLSKIDFASCTRDAKSFAPVPPVLVPAVNSESSASSTFPDTVVLALEVGVATPRVPQAHPLYTCSPSPVIKHISPSTGLVYTKSLAVVFANSGTLSFPSKSAELLKTIGADITCDSPSLSIRSKSSTVIYPPVHSSQAFLSPAISTPPFCDIPLFTIVHTEFSIVTVIRSICLVLDRTIETTLPSVFIGALSSKSSLILKVPPVERAELIFHLSLNSKLLCIIIFY